uniref:HECT domain-containing protein n=1 Tax=Astyanax mexicanus TaxID=7994 RepID=A0A8B9JEN5_ASTMX
MYVQPFKEGLQCLGVLGEVTKHSETLRSNYVLVLLVAMYMILHFIYIFLSYVIEGGSYPLTLSDVLIFASGASTIPRLGFPVEPELHFLHLQEGEAQRSYPEANTCSIILKLPIHSTYEHFKDKMESGILQCPTFGTI